MRIAFRELTHALEEFVFDVDGIVLAVLVGVIEHVVGEVVGGHEVIEALDVAVEYGGDVVSEVFAVRGDELVGCEGFAYGEMYVSF